MAEGDGFSRSIHLRGSYSESGCNAEGLLRAINMLTSTGTLPEGISRLASEMRILAALRIQAGKGSKQSGLLGDNGEWCPLWWPRAQMPHLNGVCKAMGQGCY